MTVMFIDSSANTKTFNDPSMEIVCRKFWSLLKNWNDAIRLIIIEFSIKST